MKPKILHYIFDKTLSNSLSLSLKLSQTLKLSLSLSLSQTLSGQTYFLIPHLFHVFQDSCISGSTFLRLQVFLGPRFSGSGSRVRVQVLEVALFSQNISDGCFCTYGGFFCTFLKSDYSYFAALL